MVDRIGAHCHTMCMLSLTSPMIIAICDLFESLTKDGVYEDIAVSICSTDFATTHDVTLKEAQTLVGCALHMTGNIEYGGVQ